MTGQNNNYVPKIINKRASCVVNKVNKKIGRLVKVNQASKIKQNDHKTKTNTKGGAPTGTNTALTRINRTKKTNEK